MAEPADIANAVIRDEIEGSFSSVPDEIERNVAHFARMRPEMQDIAAALIEGDNHTVDALTTQALEAGTEALEIMDDGLIAGHGYRRHQVPRELHLSCPRCWRARGR